jgi:hypothetical protein
MQRQMALPARRARRAAYFLPKPFDPQVLFQDFTSKRALSEARMAGFLVMPTLRGTRAVLNLVLVR